MNEWNIYLFIFFVMYIDIYIYSSRDDAYLEAFLELNSWLNTSIFAAWKLLWI